MKCRRDPSRTFFGPWVAAALFLGCAPDRTPAPAFAAQSEVHAAEPLQAGLPDWPIKLRNVVETLKRNLEEAETQHEMHSAASDLYCVYDVMLKDRITLELAELKGEERERFLAEIEEWRAERLRIAKLDAKVYEGGSMEPFAHSMSLMGTTQKRLEDFDAGL